MKRAIRVRNVSTSRKRSFVYSVASAGTIGHGAQGFRRRMSSCFTARLPSRGFLVDRLIARIWARVVRLALVANPRSGQG